MKGFSPLRRSDPDWFVFRWRSGALVTPWQPETEYAVGDITQPMPGNGYFMECTSIANDESWGLSAAYPPAVLAQHGAVIGDGSLVWTMKAPGSVSLATIASAAYSISPAGISQADSSDNAALGLTMVRLDASGADLGTYEIVATMTDSAGEEHTASAYITVID